MQITPTIYFEQMKEKVYYSFEPFFSKLMGTCEIYTFCSVGCSGLIGGGGGGGGPEGVISVSGLLHVLSGFTSVQLFGSIFMILSPHASIFHLFPLTPPPPSFHTLPLPAGRHSVSMMWD